MCGSVTDNGYGVTGVITGVGSSTSLWSTHLQGVLEDVLEDVLEGDLKWMGVVLTSVGKSTSLGSTHLVFFMHHIVYHWLQTIRSGKTQKVFEDLYVFAGCVVTERDDTDQ